MKISEIITDKYKLRMPPTVYYELLADVVEVEEDQEPISVIEDIKAEIKQWYWQADKQALAKDPCVVDAMVDLFIRTINKHISGKEHDGNSDKLGKENV